MTNLKMLESLLESTDNIMHVDDVNKAMSLFKLRSEIERTIYRHKEYSQDIPGVTFPGTKIDDELVLFFEKKVLELTT